MCLLGLVTLASTGASPQSTADLDISISGLRNNSGSVMLCLTRRPGDKFLDCAKDPGRTMKVVAARDARSIHVAGLAAGDYALLVIHDENRNGRLDKMFGMPREGFGFSRNPALRMGPPAYRDVQFTVSGHSSQAVRLKYLL